MFEDKDLLWDDEGKPRKIKKEKRKKRSKGGIYIKKLLGYKKKLNVKCLWRENTLSWKIKNMKYERVWFNKKIEV